MTLPARTTLLLAKRKDKRSPRELPGRCNELLNGLGGGHRPSPRREKVQAGPLLTRQPELTKNTSNLGPTQEKGKGGKRDRAQPDQAPPSR